MASAPKSVRHVRQRVRHLVRHQTRAAIGLCGMCGKTQARTCTRLAFVRVQRMKNRSHVRENMPHMPHMPHTPLSMRVSDVRHRAFIPHTSRTEKIVEVVWLRP